MLDVRLSVFCVADLFFWRVLQVEFLGLLNNSLGIAEERLRTGRLLFLPLKPTCESTEGATLVVAVESFPCRMS